MNRLPLIYLLAGSLAAVAQTPTPAPTPTPPPPLPKVTWADAIAKADAARIVASLLHLEIPLSGDSSLGTRRMKLCARLQAEGLTPGLRTDCERWEHDFQHQ